MRLRFHLRENCNIVFAGMVRDFGGKVQSKMQTQAHSVNRP